VTLAGAATAAAAAERSADRAADPCSFIVGLRSGVDP
jgi:hypothetical protein